MRDPEPPYRNIPQALARQVALGPERTALIYLGAEISFGQLWSWGQALARGLAARGVEPGHRVMLYMPNCPQWVAGWLATLLCGAVAVPVPPVYPAADLRDVARDSGAGAILTTDVGLGYVTQVWPDTGFRLAVWTNLADSLPWSKRALGLMFDRVPDGRVPRRADVISFKSLLKVSGPDLECPAGPGGLAEIFYTGGTTGRPRGVPMSHGLLLDPVAVQLAVAYPAVPRGENVALMTTPLFHILGQTFGLGPLYMNGEKAVLLPVTNLDGLMRAVERHRARSIYGVPGMFRAILEHDRLASYDLSSISYCFSGGDTLPPEVGARWQKLFGVTIGQGYGATETGGGVSLFRPGEDTPPGSVGRPLGFRHTLIVDPSSLEPVAPGRSGELLVHSEPMVDSYWNRPEETAKAFIRLDGRLYYRTGDIMRLDRDGYLNFVDRGVDAILVDGRRISASEVEAAICEHPAVITACAVGVPTGPGREAVKAIVVLRDNTAGLGSRELLDWLSGRMAAEALPRWVEFRDALPKSKVGKLLRREIREDEKARLAAGRWDAAAEE